MDIDALETQLAHLNTWRRANLELIGTPEWKRTTIASRLLNDLIDEGGGTPEQRAEVIRRLNSASN